MWLLKNGKIISKITGELSKKCKSVEKVQLAEYSNENRFLNKKNEFVIG